MPPTSSAPTPALKRRNTPLAVRQDLAAWWTQHAPRLADLPRSCALNRVRTEFLDTFVTALLQLKARGGTPPLDRFKLAGVIATWWTDTLPDFKTLLENGFPGVMDGWVDAIADAVEDDDNAGPAFDPFGHKLVRRTMTDYLERIAAAKADIGRLKGEKEAVEQSNAPDDLDEEERAAWNYAKDLDRQIRELKPENKDALKELAKLEKQAARSVAQTSKSAVSQVSKPAGRRTFNAGRSADLEVGDTAGLETCATLRTQLQPVLDQLASLEAAVQPAVAEKRQELVRFIEGLWDKYRVTLTTLRTNRAEVEGQLEQFLSKLSYR